MASSRKATRPAYSGRGSTKFWARINALRDPHREYLYTMGCNLQDAEVRLLRLLLLDEAEGAARKRKKGVSRG